MAVEGGPFCACEFPTRFLCSISPDPLSQVSVSSPRFLCRFPDFVFLSPVSFFLLGFFIVSFAPKC